MTPLAPIFMSTYRRLDHVKTALEALARNPLAAESTLYFSSDGPLPQHRDEVFAVRRYLEKVEGFAHVELRFYDTNNRKQIWDLRREVSKTHGRYIYLEEDCVTSPNYLRFMNACLDRYEDDEQVHGIAGYTPPIPEMAGSDLKLYRVPYCNVWGFGSWEKKDCRIEHEVPIEDYLRTLRSKELRRKAFDSLGVPFLGMLRKIARKELFGYDIPANHEIIKRDLCLIYPSQSFISNTGFDGSGEHCGSSPEYGVTVYGGERERWDDIEEVTSPEVNRAFGRFNGTTPRNRFRFYSKWLRGKMDP